jgi:hypothetical protein
MTTTAREETTRLADLLRREHHALGDFLVALAAFDRERRWMELGHASLFYFLRRELRLSAGAAQYRALPSASWSRRSGRIPRPKRPRPSPSPPLGRSSFGRPNQPRLARW